MKRTRVYRDEFVFSILKCMYDIPLVVFHLGGGIIPQTLNNFEMLVATKKKLVENYSDILFKCSREYLKEMRLFVVVYVILKENGTVGHDDDDRWT